MAMTQYNGDPEVISKLGTTPQERGLTTEQFKAKFDEGLTAFVTWFNDTHKTEFDATQTELTTHKADMATQLALKVNKSDIQDMRIKIFRAGISGNVTVTFSKSGFFLILINRANTSTRGIYFADTYTTTVDRWVINTLSAASDIIITTGANTLNFANGSATNYADIMIVSFSGSIMT